MIKENTKKITVIGSGPGGMEAALTAAHLGAEVKIIEEGLLGGTCLNHGCIPTKIYLAGASLLEMIKNSKFYGVTIEDTKLVQSEILERKNRELEMLIAGIKQQFDELNIELVNGKGYLIDKNTVGVIKEDGQEERIESDYIILATGSLPITPEIFKIDGDAVITSNEILELDNLPESMIIVGGNVVASEVAQYLNRFGVKVTIIEALDHLVPFEDIDVARQLTRVLKREGIKIHTKTRIDRVQAQENSVKVIAENGKTFEAEKILVCIGRKPNTEYLNLDALGIETDEKGFIKTNKALQTACENIYAIGDILNSPMLAHVASHEGITAAYNATRDEKSEMDYSAIPRCIYTDPEIAAVGLTEKEAQERGIDYKKGVYNLKMLGKAHVVNKARGFVKVITDKSGVIIGASIVGYGASEMLSELTLAVNLGLTANALAFTIHPHPTFSEAVMEACRNVC